MTLIQYIDLLELRHGTAMGPLLLSVSLRLQTPAPSLLTVGQHLDPELQCQVSWNLVHIDRMPMSRCVLIETTR